MPRKKLPVLLAALLFKTTSSLAQSPVAPGAAPAPTPDYQQVSVPVPRAVTLATDVVRVLISRNQDQDKVQELIDRRRERSKKGGQSINLSIPKNGFTRLLGLVD